MHSYSCAILHVGRMAFASPESTMTARTQEGELSDGTSTLRRKLLEVAELGACSSCRDSVCAIKLGPYCLDPGCGGEYGCAAMEEG